MLAEAEHAVIDLQHVDRQHQRQQIQNECQDGNDRSPVTIARLMTLRKTIANPDPTRIANPERSSTGSRMTS